MLIVALLLIGLGVVAIAFLLSRIEDALRKPPEGPPPLATTDHALARFDGTAGTLQNSTPTLDDAGHLDHLADPVGPQQAATKAYVDAAIAAALAGLPGPEPPDPGTLAPLTFDDLTFLGQQNVDLQYANLCFTFRYVAGERRFLFYEFDGTGTFPNRVGDLVEYRLHSKGLKNGDVHWTYADVPTVQEVRRWRTWHTRQRLLEDHYPNANNIFNGNGAWPASFQWDEATGRLWYTWQPQYPGGSIQWAAYSAVTLADDEAILPGDATTASRVVSEAHIHGPWYFRDPAEFDDFKQAACGFIPIPPARQAAMGGTHLAVGHHSANVGSKGPRGCSFWTVKSLPTTLPAEGAPLWPGADAVLVFDTSPATGATPVSNLKLPNVQFQACQHTSQGTHIAVSAGGATPLKAITPCPVGTQVDEALYQHDYGTIDCVAVYMAAPAQGGAFVPEIWNGSTWVQPNGWALSTGAADLSGPVNVFAWPQVFIPDTDPDGPGPIEPGTYIRLRRTSAGTTAGTVKAIVTSTSMVTGHEYPDRPLGAGGSAPLGSEQYDADHYAYAYEEFLWGGAWVRTSQVEGLAYFGPIRAGGLWYGAAPAYMKPVGGGTPIERVFYQAVESWTNGGKSEGPGYPYAFTFATDHLLEAAAGTRERNGHGIQPEAFVRMTDQWPAIIHAGTVSNPNSPYYGEVAYNLYGSGHSVCFDPQTNQVLLWMSNAAVYSGKPMLAVFQVR